jgi:putative ubiquitin-RnfH superfamily antitoxin RatB of RatAB toxin-antitoxin module
MAADEIQVEVVYAGAAEHVVIGLSLPSGTTVREAIELSRVAERCRDLNLDRAAVGIFGKVVAADSVLRSGDRVEIYRPLVADPKQVRRRRAAAKP